MISLHKIGQWYENRGLVGEKQLALVQTVVAVSGKPMGFGLEAPAGSGKTATMDLLVGNGDGEDTALIKQSNIYFKDAGSTTSFFYDADKINKAKLVVFMELQKDKGHSTVEAIKSMTEGKSATRKVTDIAHGEVKNQEIKPKTVMYTLAIENDTKPDAELRRRCITMSTDISKEQTADVLNLKARLRWDPDSIKIMDDEEAEDIRNKVNRVLNYSFKIVNPFALEFAKIVADIAPDQKVRSMMEHFWDVLEGVVKLNNATDAIYVGEGGSKVLANVQDLYQTIDIYKDSFLRDVYSIPPLGDIILKGFDNVSQVKATDKGPSNVDLSKFGATSDNHQWVDVNHLRKAIKEEQKVVLAKNVVIQICRQLVDAGYLEDWKDGQVIKYQVQEKFREFSKPSFDRLIENASMLVKAKYPEVYDKWYSRQFEPYVHPITGKKVEITDKTGTFLDEEEIV